MTECKQTPFEFQGLNRRKVEVDFRGGQVSSDGCKRARFVLKMGGVLCTFWDGRVARVPGGT